MIKLKEVKAKSEDSGSKARQYLDGLLKIPFGIYKQEPILTVMNDMRRIFNDLMQKINVSSLQEITFPVKNNYTSLEICKYKNILREKYSNNLNENIVLKIKTILNDCSRNELINNIIAINKINKKHKIYKTIYFVFI